MSLLIYCSLSFDKTRICYCYFAISFFNFYSSFSYYFNFASNAKLFYFYASISFSEIVFCFSYYLLFLFSSAIVSASFFSSLLNYYNSSVSSFTSFKLSWTSLVFELTSFSKLVFYFLMAILSLLS